MSIITLNGILVVVIVFHLGTSLTGNNTALPLGASPWPGDGAGAGAGTESSSGHVRSKSEMEMVPYIK